MWKDFVAINGSECVRALICIAIDNPLGGGRREQSSRSMDQNILYPMEVNTVLKAHKHCIFDSS